MPHLADLARAGSWVLNLQFNLEACDLVPARRPAAWFDEQRERSPGTTLAEA